MSRQKRGPIIRHRLPAGTGMGKDILGAIVDVEREIEERLAEERRRAGTMLDGLRQELEGEAGREEERLTAARRNAESAARAEAQERAAIIARSAATRAERLAGLDDGTLEGCIMRHLVRIMPGEHR